MLDLSSFKQVGKGLGFTMHEVQPGLLYLIVSEQPYAHLPFEYKLCNFSTGVESYYYTTDQVEKALSQV